jgi:hypothetical protein
MDGLVKIVNADALHEGMMEEISTKLSQVMMQRSSFIRNVVANAIEEVYNDTNEELNVSIAPTLSVQPLRFCPPIAFTGELLEGIISNYIDKDIPTYKPDLKFSDLTDADILRGLTSVYGEEAMQDIASLIAASPVSISSIYNKTFRNVTPVNYPLYGVRVAPTYMFFGGIEAALIVYMAHAMGSGALDEHVLGTPEGLQVAAIAAVVPATQTVNRVLNDINKDTQTAIFAKDVVKVEGKDIVVIASNKYDALITAGGIELLTGLSLQVIANGRERVVGYMNDGTFMVLEDVRDAALGRFKSSMHTATIAAKVNEVSKTRLALTKTLVGAINRGEITLPEDLTELQALARARNEVSKVVVVSRDRLYETVRNVICRAIYPDSGAIEFLTLLDEIGSKELGETPNEVATLAAVQLYARWAKNQLG